MSNQRSLVWNYFKKGDENDDPTCKLCKKKGKTKAGNTTNLMSHLKTNHLLVYTTLNRARKRTLSTSGTTAESSPTTTAQKSSSQPSIIEAMEKRAPLQPGQKRAEEITDAIAYYLAKDSVSFNAVDRPGFHQLLKVLEPRYQMSLTFSRQRIAKLYDATRENVLDSLKKIEFLTLQYNKSTTYVIVIVLQQI